MLEYTNAYNRVLKLFPHLKPTNKERFCPICNNYFSNFYAFGLFPRECMCPICYSMERDRILYHILQDKNLNSKNFLAFTPHNWLYLYLKNLNCRLYSCNINPVKEEYKIDITNIDFEDKKFDYIECSHILEHVYEDKKAISELLRVLKDDGTLYISIPTYQTIDETPNVTDSFERIERFLQEDHIRRYTIDSFIERLKSFKNISYKLITGYDFPYKQREQELLIGRILGSGDPENEKSLRYSKQYSEDHKYFDMLYNNGKFKKQIMSLYSEYIDALFIIKKE